MRTKNAKRLWPVPVTLGIMALAALLAFGLMATPGAQPAAAQDDPDCTVPAGALSAAMCSAEGDTAMVKFVGEAIGEDELNRYLLIEDSSGPIRVYPAGTDYSMANGFQDSGNDVTVTRYRYQLVTVPESAFNAQGVRKAQSVTIEVSGDVLIWADPANDTDFLGVTEAITSAPNDERRVAADGLLLDITFLGPPALGEDLDTDFNKKLDDDTSLQQCVVDDENEANDRRLVGEDTACASADTDTGRLSGEWEQSSLVVDVTETRSKLVVRTGLVGARGTTATGLIDGGMVTHTVAGPDAEVTIYARVQDAKGEDLLGMPVDFVATTEPAGIVATRDLSDDPETRALTISSVAQENEDEEIQVLDLGTADVGLADEATLAAGDAIAAFTLDNLPADTSFRITVKVTAGDLDLGTVVIARTGDPTKIVAGVFNIECFDKGAANDYANAIFDAEAKGCDASGMANHFGHGEMFVVKAHHEDSLDLPVSGAESLSIKLDDEEDNLLDGGDPDDIDNPVDPEVAGGDPAQAWVYTIYDEATLGERMITVSTGLENEDGDKLDPVTLAITVAGPPHSYELEGPDYIPLGGSGAFTVTATDEMGILPHFTADDTETPNEDESNDTINVFVADVPQGNVRGLDGGNNLKLRADTGMGTFTVFSPRDAQQGDPLRVFIGDNTTPDHTAMFGDDPDPDAVDPPTDTTVPADEKLGKATDIVEGDLNSGGIVQIDWTAAPNAESYAIYAVNVAEASDDDGEVVSRAVNNADATTHNIDGLTVGQEYAIYVVATASGQDAVWPDAAVRVTAAR